MELKGNDSAFSIGILACNFNCEWRAVIDNRLEPTDDSHLGRLITYPARLQEGVVTWVAQDLRNERLQDLMWLNRATPARRRTSVSSRDS